jgi:hypothetical protein
LERTTRIDLLTLGLYYLQNFENYEILRGRSSIGNYHLKKEFSRAYISPSDVVFPQKIVCPMRQLKFKKMKNLYLKMNR